METNQKTVLSIGARPGEAECLSLGTLILLRDLGWSVHVASLVRSPGESNPPQTGRRRTLPKGCPDIHDLGADTDIALYDHPSVLRLLGLIRRVRPMIVLTAHPQDYSVDHEMIHRMAVTACLNAADPGIPAPDAEAPLQKVPFYYDLDTTEGKDRYGAAVRPGTWVAIDRVMKTHDRILRGMGNRPGGPGADPATWDEALQRVRALAQRRGVESGCRFAEAFTQRLGFGFPHDHILKKELGDLVQSA